MEKESTQVYKSYLDENKKKEIITSLEEEIKSIREKFMLKQPNHIVPTKNLGFNEPYELDNENFENNTQTKLKSNVYSSYNNHKEYGGQVSSVPISMRDKFSNISVNSGPNSEYGKTNQLSKVNVISYEDDFNEFNDKYNSNNEESPEKYPKGNNMVVSFNPSYKKDNYEPKNNKSVKVENDYSYKPDSYTYNNYLQNEDNEVMIEQYFFNFRDPDEMEEQPRDLEQEISMSMNGSINQSKYSQKEISNQNFYNQNNLLQNNSQYNTTNSYKKVLGNNHSKFPNSTNKFNREANDQTLKAKEYKLFNESPKKYNTQ